jgi:hypothetical protein
MSLNWTERVAEQFNAVVIGQTHLLRRLTQALIAGGHVLLEGVPGLGKTQSVLTLARCLDASFHRLQFTPDLLPSDITGTMIYEAGSGRFTTRKGPVFANLVLADADASADPHTREIAKYDIEVVKLQLLRHAPGSNPPPPQPDAEPDPSADDLANVAAAESTPKPPRKAEAQPKDW